MPKTTKKPLSAVAKKTKKGALRAKVKRAGLIKGDEKISKSDMSKMSKKAKKTGDTKLKRQINLAKTYTKYRPKKKK